jgi:hypothetical protein
VHIAADGSWLASIGDTSIVARAIELGIAPGGLDADLPVVDGAATTT